MTISLGVGERGAGRTGGRSDGDHGEAAAFYSPAARSDIPATSSSPSTTTTTTTTARTLGAGAGAAPSASSLDDDLMDLSARVVRGFVTRVARFPMALAFKLWAAQAR